MVVDIVRERRADSLFHALSDTTRRDIVLRTLTEEQSVSELARPYAMSFAAVQKHVVVLERAGLVTKRRHGREQLVRGNVTSIRTALALLEELELIWRGRVDRMHEILSEDNSKGAIR